MTRFFSCLAALLSLALIGCAPAVQQANPRPNIDLEPSSESLALVLADAVHDAYDVPEQNGIGMFSVEGWRGTLAAGFDAGFRDQFAAPRAADASDLRIEIAEAELSLVPGDVAGGGMLASPTVITARASVRYKARLIAADGTVLGRSARTAESKIKGGGSMTRLAESAVETMYEQIADEFFGPQR